MRAVLPANRAWLGYLVVGVLVVVLYYVTIAAGASPYAHVATYDLVSLSAAVIVMYRCIGKGARPRLPWLLIGLSQVVYSAADTIFYVWHYILGNLAFPGLADIFYFAHYPLIVAGLLILIRLRAPEGDVHGVLDAAMLVVVAAMLSWLYLIGPNARADVSGEVKVASTAYPVLDLAMLAVSLLLILGAGRRPMAFSLLSINLLAFLGADSIYVYQQLIGTYQSGNFIDAIWLAGNLALGAAALHPTAAQVSESAPVDHRLSGFRIAALLAAALVAPVILVYQSLTGYLHDIPAIAIACAVLFALIITRLAGLVSEHRRLAITDGLTSLYTRRFLETQLPIELARARRSGHGMAVLIVDVDHFKAINDRYGHPVGDRVLMEIAHRLRQVTRTGDVLSRYGGEEFAVLATNADSAEVAVIADRLRERVGGTPVSVGSATEIQVTVSVGTASFPAHGSTPAELVVAADRALYTAKENGRDRVVAADEATDRVEPGYTEVTGTELAYLLRVAEEVDSWTSTHRNGEQVAALAAQLCSALGHDQATVHNIRMAGQLHDIGKLFIPKRIWTKAEALSAEEWRQVRTYPHRGFQMLRVVPGLTAAAQIVREHKEHYDGSGYPDGKGGTEIRIEARILAVCDAWVSMLTELVYEPALAPELAAERLRQSKGTFFDPDVVDAFLRLREQEIPAARRLQSATPF